MGVYIKVVGTVSHNRSLSCCQYQKLSFYTGNSLDWAHLFARLLEPLLTDLSHSLRREQVEAKNRRKAETSECGRETQRAQVLWAPQPVNPLLPSLTAVMSQWKVLASSAHRQLEA